MPCSRPRVAGDEVLERVLIENSGSRSLRLIGGTFCTLMMCWDRSKERTEDGIFIRMMAVDEESFNRK